MVTRCWLEIVYDWGDEGLTLARTTNPGLLALAKQQAMQEAESRLAISQQVDEIISLLDQIELERLQRTLSMLIPGVEAAGDVR